MDWEHDPINTTRKISRYLLSVFFFLIYSINIVFFGCVFFYLFQQYPSQVAMVDSLVHGRNTS